MIPTTMVTGLQLETGIVTLDAPHGDLLARAAGRLARWQEEADQAAAEMGRLAEAGVFLDPDGAPVLPMWWERKDRPYRYLVWPAAYARRIGIARRQYVRMEAYPELEEKRRRTLAYADLKVRHDRLTAQIAKAGQELAKLAEKHGW